MSLLSRTFFQWSAIAALVLLSGCGGGGGGGGGGNDGPAANTATRTQGLYTGVVGGTYYVPDVYVISPNFQLLLLEDGTYFLMTGSGTDGALEVSGLIQGSGTETGSTTFASTSALDFGYAPPLSFNFELNTNYSSGTFFATASNSIVYVAFTGAPISASVYDYNTPAQLSDVAGSWDFSVGGDVVAALTINPNGTYSGTDVDGCSSSGTLTLRPSGKNVFNVTYLDGPAPCTEPGSTGTDVAIVTTPATGPRRLYLMGTAPNRSDGFAVVGTPTPS